MKASELIEGLQIITRTQPDAEVDAQHQAFQGHTGRTAGLAEQPATAEPEGFMKRATSLARPTSPARGAGRSSAFRWSD